MTWGTFSLYWTAWNSGASPSRMRAGSAAYSQTSHHRPRDHAVICTRCFGKGRLPVEIPIYRPPGKVRVHGLERPCDNPGCLGGYVYCCEPEVNRWDGERLEICRPK